MANYIVLSTFYHNKPSANGICANNIVNELMLNNNSVDIICYKNLYSSEKKTCIHEINFEYSPQKGIIKKLIRFTQRLHSPLINKKLVDDYFTKILEIISDKRIDCIIAMCFPLEALLAAYLVKQIHSNIIIIDYELDSVIDGVDYRQSKNKKRIYEKWFTEIYQKIDYIFIMKSHLEYWNKSFCYFKDKLRAVDIPVLIPKTNNNVINNNIPLLIYSGLIEKRYRSPNYLLELFDYIKDKIEYELVFFSKGDCERTISEYVKDNSKIKQYGYVSQGELELVMKKANFFVNIGNSFSNSVPSKLINYISYNKPIIHFSPNYSDVCLSYLKEYPLALIVDQNIPIEQEAERIIDFIRNHKCADFKVNINKIFEMNTPKFSSDIIQKCVEIGGVICE